MFGDVNVENESMERNVLPGQRKQVEYAGLQKIWNFHTKIIAIMKDVGLEANVNSNLTPTLMTTAYNPVQNADWKIRWKSLSNSRSASLSYSPW